MARRKSTKTENETPVQENAMTTATGFNPTAVKVEKVEPIQSTTRGDKYANNPFIDDVKTSYDTGETFGIEVTASQAGEAAGWLRNAADRQSLGLAVRFRYLGIDENDQEESVTVARPQDLPDHSENDYPVYVSFKAKNARQVKARGKANCEVCGKALTVNADGTMRDHKAETGTGSCDGSGRPTSQPEDQTEDQGEDLGENPDA